jgi:hypothetical protein
MTRVVLVLCIALAGSSLALAESGSDTPEPGTTEAIAAATSDPRFSSPWVASVPESPTVPSPSDFLGRIAGAPGELAKTAQAHGYLRAVAEASPRVRVFTIGRSEAGRDILMAAIADEAGIRDLEGLQAAAAALADPRRTDPAAAETLLDTARPIYYFNAVIHADETGSTEAMLELAYRLAVSEQPMIRQIRERLVVLINPVSNPDGRDRVVEWFYRFLKGKTDYEDLPRQSPPYWSNYAFVDINRDGHQQAHQSTRAIHGMFHAWHPTVVHDLHEALPLLLTWNGTGPYNPHIDPITHGEFLEMAFHEVQALTALGMPGVWTWKFGEGFGHYYQESVAMNHNALGRGYETWGNTTAERVRRVAEKSSVTREWYRPLPAPREFVWGPRDNVNYTQTAALAALDYTAKNARDLLKNFYRKGYNSWRKGLEEPPYAFVIPQDQGDPGRVADLVGRLLDQRIEVGRARAPLAFPEGSFPVGTFVVRLDQPYRNFAVDLLTPQEYPLDAAEPYDDISWSLPAHFRLDAIPIADPAARGVSLVPVTSRPRAEARVPRASAAYLLADTGQESLLAARYRLQRFRVDVAREAFRSGADAYPAGSWILRDQEGLREAVQALARDLGLSFGSGSLPDVPTREAAAPRLGVWVPWADTDSIGWIRYVLDQRQVPYTYVRDEDVRDGSFAESVDVLLYGHVDLELAEQIHGLPKRWSPMPYQKTLETPSHGYPVGSDDITGGIGWEGLARIQRFVEDGGLLVTLGSGSSLALEGGIVRGVRLAAGGVPRSSDGGGAASAGASQNAATRTPGSHVRARFARADHPIAYGYPERTHVFRQNFPLYDAPLRWLRMAYCTSCLDGPEDRGGIVMEWGDPSEASLVVSGQVWGAERLVGRPAILDLPVGRGHVVAFNFNPIHRDLNRGDHRLLWNALLHWQAILRPDD